MAGSIAPLTIWRRGSAVTRQTGYTKCFLAEDTGIFNGGTLFTTTVSQFSDPASTNTTGSSALMVLSEELCLMGCAQ